MTTIADVLAGTARWTVERGDCREVMAMLPAASIDAVVCDPPYELGFMGKAWDASGIAFSVELWREVLRVLKPGGHLLAFGGTRTSHRMVCAIEDAGFEVRDSIVWLHGTGFPKSLNLGDGRGTALKPAHEPVCVARKPFAGTVAGNVAAHGTGALNVDGCRIDSGARPLREADWKEKGLGEFSWGSRAAGETSRGRWPANVVLSHIGPDEHGEGGCREVGTRRVRGANHVGAAVGDYSYGARSQVPSDRPFSYVSPDGTETVAAFECAPGCPVAELDRQSGTRQSGTYGMMGYGGNGEQPMPAIEGDTGGASRFFYCAKPSTAEREAGCEALPRRSAGELVDREEGSAGMGPRAGAGRTSAGRANYHPTVKSIELMRWLVRLVTPPGGVVLDPFAGSGSTGAAAMMERLRFVGIEQDTGHVAIAEARIAHWDAAPEAAQGLLFAQGAKP